MILPNPDILHLRNAAVQAIRNFFLSEGFCEVDTPIRIPAPAPEPFIVAEPAGNAFLRTSPELHMKRLLAAGSGPIFQIGPCFRAGEFGSRHRTEFTMLEWYRPQADYMHILADMQKLLPVVAIAVQNTPSTSQRCPNHLPPSRPWNIQTIQNIYLQQAGWNPVTSFDPDRFDLDMVNRIEPSLPDHTCTILIDYPTPVAALARRKPTQPLVAERWELYWGQLELANAFSELTDSNEQRQRFDEAIEKKRDCNEPVYPMDEAFLAALEHLPPCAGVALGFDRLLMALTGKADIAEIRAFSET